MNQWTWADHACRFCGGRLGQSDAAPPVFQCGNCLCVAKGVPDEICGCGVWISSRPLKPGPQKPGRKRTPPPGPRFRCIANPARSPSNPAAIIIAYGDWT